MESNPSVSLSATQSYQSPARGVSPQPPLKVNFAHHFPGNSPPIRAPLTLDSDKVDGGGSCSSISYSSSESEGFLSGEEDFETASERPFVADPDDEDLEIDAEEEDGGCPPVEPTLMPKAHVSGDDDDDVLFNEDLGNEVEDDDFSGVVRVPTVVESRTSDVAVGTADVRVLENEEGEEVGPSLGRDSSVVEILVGNGLPGATGLVSEEPKTIEEVCSHENRGLVGSFENVVLGSEIEGTLFGKNPVLDSVSMESIENMIPVPTETHVEVLVEGDSDEDTLLEKPKICEVLKPNGKEGSVVVGKEQEVYDLKGGVEDGKSGEVLDIDHSVSVDSTAGMNLFLDAKLPSKVEENGVSCVREAELPVKSYRVLGGETDQASPIIDELVDSKFFVTDKYVNSRSRGDSFIEVEQPVLSELESGVVSGAEDSKFSETKVVELLVDKSATLGIESDQSTSVVDEPVNSKSAGADTNFASAVKHSSSEKNFEPVMESSVEIQIPVPPESKSDVTEVQTDDYEKNGADVNECASLHPDNNSDNPDHETEPQADSRAPSYDPMLTLVAGGVESEDNDKVDEMDGAQTGDPITKCTEGNSAEDEKSQVLIPESINLLENSDTCVAAQDEDAVCANPQTPESAVLSSILDQLVKQKVTNGVNPVMNYEEEDEGSVSDEDVKGLIFNGSETAEHIMKELEQVSGFSSHFGVDGSGDYSQGVDGQIVVESDEDMDTEGEGDEKELFDSAALTALLKAATSAGSDGSNITITSPDGSRLFTFERPAGLGSSIRSLQPANQPNRTNLFTPSDLMVGGESESNLSEEARKMMEKIQLIRVKFLRLIQRLGHSPDDSIAGQVLYRMILAGGRHTNQSFSLETAKRTAMQLEEDGKDDLDFSLNILVLGKTGVGKSATINSIFGEEKALINAFEPATTSVKEIIGTIDGVKIRVYDTPGLRSSVMDQAFNQKVLSSVKKFTKKCPPDIVLYVDRLDTQTRDLNDLPLLRSMTSTLGSSIWRSAIVTLTHAASAPPDGPSGSPLSYEVFVAQRSHVVQLSIGQAVGDLRSMNPSLMNPVSLAENHPSCRRNREGQKILPNGQSWRSQLLLLCYSMKILSEVSSLSKSQDLIDPRKLFGSRVRSPPLPYLLSSLLQSRAHPKLPNDQGGENADSDIDLGDLSDSDHEEEEDEYDQLPPFKPLRKSQIARLSKEQRKAYFDEYDYRVKLLQKKQWREELKRLKEMKKKGKNSTDDYGYMGEDVDQEHGSPAAVPVPLPDMVLPPSFDGDNPAYRYRFLEPTSQLLARPVLDSHGWDHDCGFDGVSLEENIAIAGQFPAGISVQITKDKKEFNIHLDSSVATKHGKSGSTLVGFDIQTIGKQLAYILRGDTKFKIFKKNKIATGISFTSLGENVATGLKVEDEIAIGKRLVLVGSVGAIRSRSDVAYGANLEARLKEKDYPIGQDQSTLGLSLMRWRGDLALGANWQSQFSIGRSSKMAVRVGLNNKLSGQITVRTSSSEQLQIALMGILPIANAIYRGFWSVASDSYPKY